MSESVGAQTKDVEACLGLKDYDILEYIIEEMDGKTYHRR